MPLPGRSRRPTRPANSHSSAVSEDVSRVGPEPVRGVRSMHYAATIDLGHDQSRAAATVREHLAPLGAAVGDGRLALDVWLDGAGRVRRIVVSVPLRSAAIAGAGDIAGPGPQASMRIQTDFFGFGATVDVAAPPHAQVRPYSTLRIAAANG